MITIKKHSLALLLDPEKANLEKLSITSECHPDYIFVGGSTGGDTTEFVENLRLKIEDLQCTIPIILFPGNAAQFSKEADAILFLSLLSGNNPEYLVGQQIRAARAIHDSSVEVIPTAYILIDGGVETSTMRVTQTLPISSEIITAVRAATTITLIVGGGIRTPQAMNAAYAAGADIVVIGNHFESHPEQLSDFTRLNRNNPINSDDVKFMRIALAEAEKALEQDEIPIGCVIVSQNQIIGRGHNLTETLADVTAHAEIQAITAASQTLGGKYLPDATLYVTVEPCSMCAGAIGWAQISRVVYGAPDPKRGYTTYAPRAFHPKTTVTAGVLETECRDLMQEFFKRKR